MAKRYNQSELWDLLRHAVRLDHPELREPDLALVVREIKGQGPTVVGLVVAERGEDLDTLVQTFPGG